MKKYISLLCACSVLLLVGGCISSHTVCRCECRNQSAAMLPPPYYKHGIPENIPGRWSSREVAAPDSVEGQLQSQGKQWQRITGKIVVGAYVEDILEGRLHQPKGRGAVGKIVSLTTTEDGIPAATVDFGRGYSPGIKLSELSLLRIVRE